MNELSERLRLAVDFLKRNGYAGNNAEIARTVHVIESTFSMVLNGTRTPNWDLLLNFCDAYPINFWWLRSGEGSMVREDREIQLLKRIAELEEELRQLRE